jgi:hypothetical protein
MAQVPGFQPLQNGIPEWVSFDGVKYTYRVAKQALAPVATPTCFLLFQGSATMTCRIKCIRLSGGATAAGAMTVQMSRWSTAGTPGSAVLTALTAVQHDVNDPAPTAVVSTVGTANYTTQGTGYNVLLAASRLPMPAIATGGAETSLLYEFSSRSDKALIVRGTGDYISISGNGAAVPSGGVIDIEIEWEEDNS